MTRDGSSDSGLAGYAAKHKLTAAPDLPSEGELLGRDDGKFEQTAAGALGDGIDGSLAYYTYTYTWTDSDHHSHSEERRFTIAVTRVPESIGFVPYLVFSGRGSKMAPGADQDPERVKLEEGDAFDGAGLYVYRGTSREWLAELLSPAMIDWLARSPADFGIELCNGVLVAGRDGYLSSSEELDGLCADLAHFAGALRTESLEETESGGAKRSAAKAEDGGEAAKVVRARELIGTGALASAPVNVDAARAELHARAVRSPRSWRDSAVAALVILLVLNVFGIALPIVLVVNDALPLLLAIEAVLFGLIFLFTVRRSLREISGIAAREAFVAAYAEARGLKPEDPLEFAATHAEAKLPFKPDYVLTGKLPGGAEGSLAWVGAGEERDDRIAVVAGPKGPVASAELKASAPGLSQDDLDAYAKRLTGELVAKGAAAD